MDATIDLIVSNITFYLQTSGIFFGMLVIIIESFIPILPLGVFVAFNLMAFGGIVGFFISYVATIVGCILSYYFCKSLFSNYVYRKMEGNDKLKRIVKEIKNMRFHNLVLITALPFSPAFLINIAAGITRLDFKKFFLVLLISKVSIVYFWGFIGKSLLESITDVQTLFSVSIILTVTYFLSRLISIKMKIE